MNIKVTTLKAGQPRPYADSYYEYEVEFEFAISLEQAIAFASFLRGGKNLITKKYSLNDQFDDHFAPHLMELTDCDKGRRWKIKIQEAYCD